MNEQEGSAAGRPENIPQYVVGMDAHARKLAISVWDWADPWNHRQVLEVKNFEIAALYSKVGAEAMKVRGFTKRADFVEAVAVPVYAHLGKPLPAAATA